MSIPRSVQSCVLRGKDRQHFQLPTAVSCLLEDFHVDRLCVVVTVRRQLDA